MANKRNTIINGPGKFDLMLALFQSKRVTFTIKEIKEVAPKARGICHVRVDSITRQDHRFNVWLIQGYFEGGYYDYLYHKHGTRFKASFEARDRKGWIETEGPFVSKRSFSP